MNFLRNRFVHRTISIFLLLIFIQSIFLPNYSYALTSGQHQPEYTSYEDAGATDMVNLLTGDFNFNIPIIDVPGPEGNFNLPLSYHAGIGLEQEASWVGLGWNINAGAIIRNINQFPDDASNDPQVVTVQDLTGIQGWNRVFNHPLRDGWNSQTGSYGNVNLLDIVDVTYGSKTDVGIVGIHVGEDKSYFNAVQFGSAVVNIVSLGAGSAGTTAASFAKQAAISMAIQSAVSFAMPVNTPQVSTSGYWSPRNDTDKSIKLHSTASFLSAIPVVSKKKSYHIYIDQTRTEDMFGLLYLGDAPKASFNSSLIEYNDWYYQTINGEVAPMDFLPRPSNTTNRGSASDINFITNSLAYDQLSTPTLLASDNYAVNAPGISGAITPYRLEIGSVAMPREMTDNHIRFAPIPYLDNYKVPFVYARTNSNRYFNHLGGIQNDSPATPDFYYGLDYSYDKCFLCSRGTVVNHYNDNIFNADRRIHPEFNDTKKIPQQTFIEWLSNEEIKNSITYPSKFIDFLPSGSSKSQRKLFRADLTINPTAKGIGGYGITSADGTTYHFALPVYDYELKSEVIKVSDTTKRSIISRNSSFSNTWLLTAITGSDFIDRNENGLADEDDWGYWVKMNYGQYYDDFDWRLPLAGKTLDPSGQYKSYEQGKKQLYYLNSIETRSHVALFIKSPREDGLSSSNQAALVKLDEICLLKREVYEKLTRAPYYTPDYSNQISLNCMSSVYPAVARDFMRQNSIKRVVFTYGYDLCKGTPNTNTPNNSQKGKLTLYMISIKGRNDISVVPDFKFEYTNNPNYNANYWDGWGLYNPSGSASASSHTTNDPSGSKGSAWSLSSVTTPLGGKLLVNYERDTYSSISGQVVLGGTVGFSKFDYSISYPGAEYMQIEMGSTVGYSVNDKVRISGKAMYECSGSSTFTTKQYSGDYTISEITGTTMTLSTDYLGISDCNHGSSIYFDRNHGSINKILINKDGGNLRVGSIVMQDESGKENKLRYLYNNDDGSSSGVVSQEPDYIKNGDLPFYKYLKYPQTPVMYGKVSVLAGKLTNDSDYYSKQVFEFETPHTSMFSFVEEDKGSTTAVQKYHYKFTDRTAKIGNLKSVTIRDKNNTIISQSNLLYTEQLVNDNANNYQGLYAEGTLLADRANGRVKQNRTSFIAYPSVLKKITNIKDGYSSSTENLSWDLFTGFVNQKLEKSSLGIYVKTVLKPAYTVQAYSELGSKAKDINNKNMLLQNAATYVYRSDAAGSSLALIGAEVQTWKKDWNNYRYHNTTNYVQSPEESVSSLNRVWRKGPAYIYKGSYANLNTADGTQSFISANDFNFLALTSNPLWQYTGEILRFDHYGMPLESRNMNNIYSATKMGYSDRIVIASAANAEYNEIAFSSAEDLQSDKPFFGGEVGLGNGAVRYLSKGQTSSTHTGDAVVALSSGYAFTFKTQNLEAGKRYRAAVWTNGIYGRIYYKINGGNEQLSSAAVPSKLVNGWYRIDLDLPVQGSPFSLEIGVKSTAGEMLFDDFRFQPAEAGMTCYVYPPLDFEFTATSPTYSSFNYVLDNDNMYTKFEHNERGLLTKTYQESFKYGVKLVSESKDNYRRFHINQ